MLQEVSQATFLGLSGRRIQHGRWNTVLGSQQRCVTGGLGEQVSIQAYLLWEKAGRPDGADFAADARATLAAQLAAGMSLQELERALKAPEPQVRMPSHMHALC